MKIAFYSSKPYDRRAFDSANQTRGSEHEINYLDARLSSATTALAQGADAVCVFVNDTLDAKTLEELKEQGVRVIALRCAGFNNVDLAQAESLGLPVVRVPAYSPYAVAEHAVALILCLNRKTYRSYNRVREHNFDLNGLLGFDLHGKTIGVIGTGKIGEVFCRILQGFGCKVLAYDVQENPACLEMGVRFVELPELFSSSDVISLHCPLTPETRHLIDDEALGHMKPGVMIINTSRGAIIDTSAAIRGLKQGKIGGLGLDVYEEEGDLFFEDLSGEVLQDDVFARLLTFPNVLLTGHQAFFTAEALQAIAETTLSNLSQIERGETCENRVSTEKHLK